MSLSTLKLKGPRNALTLKNKVEVIKAARNNPQFGATKLADLSDCGRTQISSILKKRMLFLSFMKQTKQLKVSACGRGVDRANFLT